MRWLANMTGDQEVITHVCSSGTIAPASIPSQAVHLLRLGEPAEWERDGFMQRGISSDMFVIPFYPFETADDYSR